MVVLFERAAEAGLGDWRRRLVRIMKTHDLSTAFSAERRNTRYRCVHGSIRHTAR